MFPLDTNLRAARMMEAGRLTATFTSPSGQHITVNAKCRKPDDSGKWVGCSLAEAKVVFFSVPNESGFGDKIGKMTRSRGFTPDPSADDARVFCAKQMIRWLAGETLSSGLEVAEEERCGKCGRALTDPVSIARGIGPECYGASTGSEHQTKTKQSARKPAPRHPAASTGPAVSGDDYGAFPNSDGQYGPFDTKSDGLDKQGVSYGHGDWQSRKKVAATILDREVKPERESMCNRDDLYSNGIPY